MAREAITDWRKYRKAVAAAVVLVIVVVVVVAVAVAVVDDGLGWDGKDGSGS